MLNELAAAVSRTAELCAAVLPPMLLGCLAGNALASSRAGARCGRLCTPLARLAGLDEYCSTYFALCFLNFNSANIYLASLVRTGKVQPAGLLGVYLSGWLPASCHYYAFHFAPVLVPGLGIRTAGLVLLLYVTASIFIFATGVVLNRRANSQTPSEDASAEPQTAHLPAWPGWGPVIRQGTRQFIGIAAVFALCILAIEVVSALAPARALLEAIKPVIDWTGASSASVLVVTAALPSAMAGFATAIACLRDALLSPAQLPTILMAAAMGHAVFSAFSHFLPANVAIFGPMTGTRITFASLCVRLPWLSAALAAAYVLGTWAC